MGYMDPPKEYEWKPGQSGNPKGRPATSITTLLKRKLEEIPEGADKTYKEQLIDKVIMKAIRHGDKDMIKLSWNYIDGMPKQAHEITGKDGEPLMLAVPNSLYDKYKPDGTSGSDSQR